MHRIVCYLYVFAYGSYLRWAFGPNIPLLAIPGSSVKERNYQGVLWGLAVFGIRPWDASRVVYFQRDAYRRASGHGVWLEAVLSRGRRMRKMGGWGLLRVAFSMWGCPCVVGGHHVCWGPCYSRWRCPCVVGSHRLLRFVYSGTVGTSLFIYLILSIVPRTYAYIEPTLTEIIMYLSHDLLCPASW